MILNIFKRKKLLWSKVSPTPRCLLNVSNCRVINPNKITTPNVCHGYSKKEIAFVLLTELYFLKKMCSSKMFHRNTVTTVKLYFVKNCVRKKKLFFYFTFQYCSRSTLGCYLSYSVYYSVALCWRLETFQWIKRASVVAGGKGASSYCFFFFFYYSLRM